jgi:hypothetical protein
MAIPCYLLETIVFLAMITTLLNRLTIKQLWFSRSQWLAWNPIGTFLLFQARLLILGAWILTPAMSVYVFMWKSMPVVVSYVTGIGESPPKLLAGFSLVASLIGEYWWIMALLLGGPYCYLALSRCVVSTIPILSTKGDARCSRRPEAAEADLNRGW